jgi:hypothetical protein
MPSDRDARIEAALTRNGWSPIVRDRIERLLDGREDHTRLRCCGSGCHVCVLALQKALAEITAGET